MRKTSEIAIVGGGASGLAAAVEFASIARQEGVHAQVVLYEAEPRVGKSILRSGNGRCNFTNTRIGTSGDLYRNPSFVEQALLALEASETERAKGRVGVQQLCFPKASDKISSNQSLELNNAVGRFFASLGLCYRQEADGRCYPCSGKASTVLNVLRKACLQLGVRIECNTSIVKIEQIAVSAAHKSASESQSGCDFSYSVCDSKNQPNKGSCELQTRSLSQTQFLLHADNGATFSAEQVILALGGTELLYLKQLLGNPPLVEYTSTTPVLASLAVREKEFCRRMNNIRVCCLLHLMRDGNTMATEAGELLFRNYGVSGIAVFNLSRYAKPGDVLLIDFSQGLGEELLFDHFLRISDDFKERFGVSANCADVLRGIFHDVVSDVLLEATDLLGKTPAQKNNLQQLVRTICNFELSIDGIGDAKLSQALRGGVKCLVSEDQNISGNPLSHLAVSSHGEPHSGVVATTMGVVGVDGLYVTGEMLDVDAPCGGYNLHWAWASGLLAARSAVSRCIRMRQC